jgi:hypothetical protein
LTWRGSRVRITSGPPFLLFLLLTLVTTTSVYAQPVLGSIDEVTLSERIEAAETKTQTLTYNE